MVAVGVTTNAGYVFSAFSAGLSGSAAPQSLTMTAPASVTANFQADFTLSTATGMATVMAGATTSFTVNVSAPSSFTGTVTFDAPALPNGLTASFSSTSVAVSAGSGQTTMYVTAAAGSAGNYVVTARGTSGSLPPHTTGVNLAVQDFTVSLATDYIPIPPSGSASYQLTLNPLNGYSGSLAVQQVAMSPASCMSNWNLQLVSGNVYTLYVTTSSCSTFANQTATYTLNILAVSGGVSHWVPTTLTVTSAGNFSLSASALSQTVTPPATAGYLINVTAVNGFSTNVSFTVAGVPGCATVLTAPTPVSGSGGSTSLSMSTGGCAAGTYGISVTGTSGAFSNTLQLTLVIQGPPAAANITSPSANAILSGASPSFTWDSGSQVSQYQLDLTSAADGSVCAPRFVGQPPNTQATMNLAPPCCRTRQALNATLTSTFMSGSSQALNYAYTCGLPGTYTINGQVITLAAIGLSGVTVTLTGASAGSTTTDSNGNYSVSVSGGGPYTVTPSLAGYAFVPTTFPNVTANRTANFTAWSLSAQLILAATSSFEVGGSYSIVVTGLPSQFVTVNQNGTNQINRWRGRAGTAGRGYADIAFCVHCQRGEQVSERCVRHLGSLVNRHRAGFHIEPKEEVVGILPLSGA
jgi:hypothetical protein